MFRRHVMPRIMERKAHQIPVRRLKLYQNGLKTSQMYSQVVENDAELHIRAI